MAIIIGLMSGTSADGVDAGAFDIRRARGALAVRFIDSCKTAYPAELTAALKRFQPSAPIDYVMALDVEVGRIFAAAARKMIKRLGSRGIKPHLIASHGQTIHHMPEQGATLQIGSAAHIAAATGVAVWSDFRRADMAAGGQGAPLAPVAHLPLFGGANESRAVVNIGGIANLTYIPAGAISLRQLIAYDTGPGNMLIDLVAQKAIGKPMDRNGRLASSGQVSEILISKAMSHPHFKKRPPKSTGRETFGQDFMKWLFPKGRIRWDASLCATMTELAAASIAGEIGRLIKAGRPVGRVIICGGGAKNGYLMKRLAALCAPIAVEDSGEHGLGAGHVETALMAILGYHASNAEALDLCAITGASRPARLGVFTPAP